MLEEIFCFVDDFCKRTLPEMEKHLIESGVKSRKRATALSISEIMTILILFQQSHYRNLKHYYLDYACQHMRSEFPGLVSYTRFVELQKRTFVPFALLSHLISGEATGIYFIDSTPIRVCHVKRASQNRTFKNIAKKSKSTMGWFYGFKLHLVINDKGEIMAFKLTSSTTDDRKPVEDLTKNLCGKLIGDKGYIKKPLSESLLNRGLHLLTKTKKNMKPQLMTLMDKLLLRKRAIIETVNDQLKNIAQIEHTRHRSVFNFVGNILAALIAYTFQPKKPSLKTHKKNEIERIQGVTL